MKKIKELELRIETQKQTLQARDESIKKLLEMLQNKGMGKFFFSDSIFFLLIISTPHLHTYQEPNQSIHSAICIYNVLSEGKYFH